MSDWLDPAFSGRLCITLLHSVWLVAALTAIACAADRFSGKRTAEWSYVLYTSAMMLSVIAIPITWWCVDIDNTVSNNTKPHPMSVGTKSVTPKEVPSLSIITAPDSNKDDAHVAIPTSSVDYSTAAAESVAISPSPPTSLIGFAPWLAIAYLSGVVLMLLRLARSVRKNQRTRRLAETITSGPLVAVVEQLSQRWAMRVTPILMQVKGVVVPQVIGLFKPIILLPMSAVNELSIEELELILTHELAHIRRHDMWIHMVQRLAEIVLFFNPALWLLNHRISTVREYCCDDITCKAAGEPEPEVRYATAILRILEVTTSGNEPQITALAATGRSPSEVRRRIARLFNEPIVEPIRLSQSGFLACVASLAVLFVSAKLWTAEPEPVAEAQRTAKPDPAQNLGDDDVPERMFRLFVAGPDGQPVADALVEFRGSPKLSAQQIRRGTFDRTGSYGTFVKTDQNGRVTICLSDRQPSLRISIKKSGYGPYWTDWSSRQHPEDLPERFTAKLDKAWRVGGIVVDEDGKPIAGVEVNPSVDYKKRPGDRKHMGVGTSLKTDEHGAWSYDMIPISSEKNKDYVYISFNHPDFQTLRRSLKRDEFELKSGALPKVKIELPVGLTINGTVTDEAGAPVEGALVKTKFINELRQDVTDEHGKYQITGCEERNVRIVVSAKGYATDMQAHQVSAELKAVDFQLKPGGHVRVRVVDENGKGINRARIFFQSWRGPFKYFEFSHIDQYTDEEGIWEWNEAPLDEFEADISGPNRMQLLSQPLVSRAKEYVFSPPELLIISGNVLDAKTKEPVPRFRVIPGSRNEPGRGTDDWWSRDESYEARNGQYEIVRNDAAPTHMLRIEAPGYKVTRSRDILSTEGKVDISFELTPAENISVQLLTESGKPASGAEVALAIKEAQINIDKGQITDRSTFATRITADENGRFELPSRDDDFQLLATHPDGFALMKPENGALPRSVTMTKFARIEGEFRVGNKVGREVRLSLDESQVHAWGNHDIRISPQNETTTDGNGRFVFERVIPGRGFLGLEMHSMVDQGFSKAMSSRRTPIQTVAGQTTTMVLGGDGRMVTGQLVPPKKHSGQVLWNFASIYVEVFVAEPEWPEPPEDVQKDEAASEKWWAAWQESDTGKAKITEWLKQQEESQNEPSFWVSPAKDGTFQIDDVQAGKYVLSVSFSEHSPGRLPPFQFEVPKLNEDSVGKPLNIGNLEMQE